MIAYVHGKWYCTFFDSDQTLVGYCEGWGIKFATLAWPGIEPRTPESITVYHIQPQGNRNYNCHFISLLYLVLFIDLFGCLSMYVVHGLVLSLTVVAILYVRIRETVMTSK